MADLGKAEPRAREVYRQIWQRGVTDFSQIEKVTKTVLATLAERGVITVLENFATLPSDDGTTKFLWRLPDGGHIESVLIPDEDRTAGRTARYTLCVSSQVGCAMRCTFCLTGDMGLKRNLTAAEIACQVQQVQQHMDTDTPGKRITNVVMMGMGEPLHNFDNLVVSLRTILSQDALNLSHRRVTVSTVGLVPKLQELARLLPVNIAVSLNATTEAQRRTVMPITRRYSMQKLMDACRTLPLPSGKRIIFEYVMMAGFNDTNEDAARLHDLMQGVPAKVNLIPYNENPEREIRRPSDERVRTFQQYLVSRGIHCTVRITRGIDVSAACGQLGKSAESMARRIPQQAATTRSVGLSPRS